MRGPRVTRRAAAALLLITAVYFGLAKAGLAFAFENESITAVWPPTGFALAAVLLWGPRVWPAIFAGALLANLTTDSSLPAALMIAAGNTLEALAGGWLLRRVRGFSARLERVADVVALLVLGALASTVVSATAGTAAVWLDGALAADELAGAWRVWWLGDAVGDLVVAPVVLVLLARPRVPPRELALAALSAAGLVGLALVVLRGEHGQAYLLIPVVAALALGLRVTGAALGTLAVAAVGIALTSRELGPWTSGSPDGDLLASQAFAAVVAMTALLLAAARVERERARDELITSEQARVQFQQLLESAPDAMLVCAQDGRIVLVNDGAQRLFGWSRDELVGRQVEVLLPERVRERHGAHRAHYASAPAPRLMGAGLTLAARHRDGHEIPVEVSLSPIETPAGTFVSSVVRDISDRQRAQKELHEAQERFRNAFEHGPVGMALVEIAGDRLGRFLDANSALVGIAGYSESDLTATTLDSVTDPADRDADAAKLAMLLAGECESYSVEKRLRHGKGGAVWVLMSVSLVHAAGEDPGYAVLQVVDIDERKRFEGQLQHLADHDSLTGLFNRRRFQEELDHQLALNRRYGGDAAILVIDVDRFKYVNDTLGHGAGDDVLRHVALLLAGRLRDSDVLARLGGDEFAILLPQSGTLDALAVAESLAAQIREEVVVTRADQPVRLTISVGAVIADAQRYATGEDALTAADIAMYEAKESGRDRVELMSPDEEERSRLRARLSWSDRVRRALADDSFELVAQPILHLPTREITRYELLLRMLGDDDELIPPGAFLHIAEEFGSAAAIDRWVVREGIELLGSLTRAGSDVTLSLNLSAGSLGDPDLLALIAAELSAGGADPRRLVLELTETAAIVNVEKARRFADRLAEMGCGLALDDFGAGFGSFYYLKHLPFAELKIDGDFIRDLPASVTDQLTVQAIVQIARGLGKKTVAEFVGDDATLALLEGYGVDYAQGYWIGEPRPAWELLEPEVLKTTRPSA